MSLSNKLLSTVSRFLPIPGRIQRYYQSRTSEELARGGYIETDTSLVTGMIDMLTPFGLSTDDSILEVGCNAGRNLEMFRRSGFSRLTGIEINPTAIALMQETFPELHAMAETFVMPIQEVAEQMQGRRFDLVYSCAVLQHIDTDWPTARQVVSGLVGRHLLVVEVEHPSEKFTRRGYKFRNYKQEFEACGFRELKYVNEEETRNLNDHFDGYMMRVFERP